MEIRDAYFVKWPSKMRTPPTRCNKKKYYKLHKDHCHDTEEFIQLKDEIDNLIEAKWRQERRNNLDRDQKEGEDDPRDGNHPAIGTINVNICRTTLGGVVCQPGSLMPELCV